MQDGHLRAGMVVVGDAVDLRPAALAADEDDRHLAARRRRITSSSSTGLPRMMPSARGAAAASPWRPLPARAARLPLLTSTL